MTTRLLLIRHAETVHNRDSRVQGQADIELSELGEQQARAVAAHLARTPLDAVVASPLMRARLTADAIAEAQGLVPSFDPDLMEMNVGEMEGLNSAEMRERYPEFLREWVTERGPMLRMPGGESLTEVQDRAWAVVERLRREHDGRTVAIVSHNFVLSTLVTRALDLPLHQFRRFRLNVASVTTILFRPDRTLLARLNDTCHLTALDIAGGERWGGISRSAAAGG
jgi:broad specificity phosphatase PhoE